MGFSCLVCGGQSAEIFLKDCKDYFVGKPYRATYVRCKACGLVQQDPIPEDVGPFYDDYPIHVKKGMLYQAFRKVVMGPAYHRPAPAGRDAVVIDYGCGDGWYLDALVKKGWTRAGYELSPDQAMRLEKQLGIPVYSDFTKLEGDWGKKADLVTQHFVMEHLTNLHESFDNVARLLKKGGHFYFVIPHIDSWEAKLFRKKWHGLDPPRHISFPEKKHVKMMAEKYGYELIKDEPVPFSNGIAGTLPVLLSGKFRFSLFLLSMPFGVLFSRLFPTGAHSYLLVKK